MFFFLLLIIVMIKSYELFSQVSDVACGPLVYECFWSVTECQFYLLCIAILI